MRLSWFFRAVPAVCLFLFSAKAGPDIPPNSVPVRLIVLPSEAEAQSTLARLNQGADFAVLARESSIDATATDGGLLGYIDPSTLREELRDAVAKLHPGELSAPVKLPTGFAIVKMLKPDELAALAETDRARRFQISAEGSVKFSFDISGLNEAQGALSKWPKPEGWQDDPSSACTFGKDSFAAVNARADQLIANPPDAPYDRMSVRVAKGQLYAYTGDMDRALEQWEIAYANAARDLPQALPYLDKLLGIGYLHRAEMRNDLFHHPSDLCLLPLRKYNDAADALKAAGHLTEALKSNPGDLEAEWVLDIARAAAGQPVAHPLAASEEDLGRFRDVAAHAGLNIFSMAGGLIVDDFDGDGRPDVVTSSSEHCAPMQFHHNNGDGTFTNRTAGSGLEKQLGGLNLIQADYNNDGCTDILQLRGGWELPQRRSLLRNNCNGTFTDVTRESGLGDAASSQTAVWVDIDNDGNLDLFVGVENGPNQLFRNNGNGTFTNISHEAGVDIVAVTKSVTAADYDGDGYADLYVSNYGGRNALFRNNHNNTFTDVAPQAGATGGGRGFPAWFFDYDNDGRPDILASSYYISTEETVRTYRGLPHNGGTMKLYRNLGNGTFADVTAAAGLEKVFMPMGSNFGDIDNDGFLDVYLGTGNPSYAALVPNVLLHNVGGKRFTDITASSGTGELHKGHGVAFADINNDGAEDILEVVGGAVPGDSHAFRLFQNPGNGNDWVTLHLTGTHANRSAIGAQIRVDLTNSGGEKRSVYRTVSSGGSFGASPLAQHIGLGKNARIERVEIRWPGSARVQAVEGVAKNRKVEITEPK